MKRDVDEVKLLLDQWADWMARPEQMTEGYPSEAAGGWIASWIKDSEEGADAADAITIEKVNACCDSIKQRYREAINRHYNLGIRVWTFGKEATFEDAKAEIRPLFVKKGLI